MNSQIADASLITEHRLFVYRNEIPLINIVYIESIKIMQYNI